MHFILKGKYIVLGVFLLLLINPISAQKPDTLKLKIEDLFTLAETNNRSLKVSDYDQKIADEAVNDEMKKLLPSLDVSVSASYLSNGWLSDRNFSKGMSIPIPHFGNNFALEASQIIYAGGAVNTSIEIAKLNQLITQLEKDQKRQDIRFLLAGYYLELVKLNNQKQIFTHSINQTQVLLDQITAKQKQGVALRNNVTRYELQKKSLELGLLRLENNISVINNEMVTTLNLPKGTVIEVEQEQQVGDNALGNEAYWRDLAIKNAPVIQQLDLHADQAKHREQLAKSEKLPKIFAFAGDKLDGPITIEIPTINKNFNYWYAGVGVKFSLSSLYKADSKISQAQIASRRVAEQNELVKDKLSTQISTAYIRYLETFKVYETHVKSLELASQNYTVIRNRYLNDLVLITEMLDAENSKIEAVLEAANAQINILFNYYQLKTLTGTL